MTENLRLELAADDVLLPTTSDVTANTTVGLATQPYNQPSDNLYNWGVANEFSMNQTNVDKWLSRSTKVGNTWSTETNPSSTTSEDRKQNLTREDQKTGVYYNWYTATAGTGTWSMTTAGTEAQSSICPKGWELPRYSDVNGTSTLAPSGSWMGLIRDTYKIITTQGNQGSSSTALDSLHAFPLSLPNSGYVNGTTGAIIAQGVDGYYRTAGVTSQTRALIFGYGTSAGTRSIFTESSSSRLNGFNVRCIAK